MTKEEHIEKHRALHKALDELVADWLSKNLNIRLSSNPVLDLMKWSALQLDLLTISHGEVDKDA